MSNLGPMSGTSQGRVPTPPRGEPIAQYGDYLAAQRAVDFLSDHHFPVQAVTIVGTGLQMVERVTGRLTYPRVALAGAASGAWFGLFVGLLLSIFDNNGSALLAAPLFGVAFGMLFGVISYALTGGRRDFTSTSQIVASQYLVLCLAEQAGAARALLERLPGGIGETSDTGTSLSGMPPQPPYSSSSPGAGPWSASPPVPPGTPYRTHPGPPASTSPSASPAVEAPEAGSADDPDAGLTYGEAIARRRREEAERERARREGADGA